MLLACHSMQYMQLLLHLLTQTSQAKSSMQGGKKGLVYLLEATARSSFLINLYNTIYCHPSDPASKVFRFIKIRSSPVMKSPQGKCQQK